jgi:hypothetical protein
VTFENDSRMELIGERAFVLSGLKSIEIPSSVAVLGKAISISAIHLNQ